jgi:hypothetical protein
MCHNKATPILPAFIAIQHADAAQDRKEMQNLLPLLLRWYYAYQNSPQTTKHAYRSIYKDTDELLSSLREKCIINDEMCEEAYKTPFICNVKELHRLDNERVKT